MMPPFKKQPSATCFQERDFWGDETEGEKFASLLADKFGTHRGARQLAMDALDIQRRLLNMYLTGERKIPIKLLAKLKDINTSIWEDGIDPLS